MSLAARVRPRTLLLLGLLGCSGDPSGLSTGNLRVTVVGLPVGTAATVTVSGPDGFSQSVTATQTFSQITPGTYTVTASTVTVNASAYTPSPGSQTIGVAAGSAVAGATVSYSRESGALALTINGLGSASAAAVTVTGPGYSVEVPASTTLEDLTPGTYTVTARDTTATGGTPHTASPTSQSVDVLSNATASASVTYAPPPADGTVNLQIAGMYLTQSAQTFSGSVPLVQNRDGYLRVFVVASRSNAALASVKVRFFNGLIPVDSATVSGPVPVPTTADESSLSYSWNVAVPGSRVQPNLRIQAEVDPAGTVVETDETDNLYPALAPLTMDVRTVPAVDVTFVPVIQLGIPVARRVPGNVSNANTAQFVNLTQKMHPVSAINSVVHADYTTTTTDTLQALNANQAWTTILGEIDALRIAESSARYYYGVAHVSYPSGVAGVAYVSNASIGGRAAMGWDDAGTAGIIAAHELGHNWARRHSPCGGPSDIDGAYPLPDGTIGTYGVDVAAQALHPPSSKDVMGYCDPKWISDYTYRGVMNYLLNPSPPIMSMTGSGVQPGLLVWGYIRNGQPVLEPAFQLNTRPSLPAHSGPYTLSGHATDGTTLFSFSFAPNQVADALVDQQNFAFAVPLTGDRAARLASIRLAGTRGMYERSSPSGTTSTGAVQASAVEARRVAGGRLRLRWDARANPMAMVRDPGTGQVLSFARGGQVELSTSKPQLDVILSDGVRSRTRRMRVAP
jgi:hypothetical protein